MRLLIDGYNLLHATDLFGQGKLAGTLQGSREALLARLADMLSAGERRAMAIVFDAAGAPPGLPKQVHWDHMTVRYAREYADADALLEEIIETHRAPRGLTVVSSDHRVQRAARRRGAAYVDSDQWYRDLVTRRPQRPGGSTKPKPGGSVDYWVDQFQSAELEQMEAELRRTTQPKLRPKTTKRQPHAPPTADGDFENPFPPGYGEDLLDGE
ncbi:NYN domain-containing protein [Aeoliella mucimassa]|nr:NYN domain-containing protein [Aeoliella mucimassa]